MKVKVKPNDDGRVYDGDSVYIRDPDGQGYTRYDMPENAIFNSFSVQGTTNPVINDQTAKADAGKPRLSLVPLQILYDIAAVREYAVNGKYKDPDNWKQVSVERYRDALMRHLCAYITDPESKDEESGLPHLYHIACNVAFLCALDKENKADN